MSLFEKFFARPRQSVRYGDHYSLRVITTTSRLPGDRSYEFALLRKEAKGWNVRADDEGMDRHLKAVCYHAGANADLSTVLTAIRDAYLERQASEFGIAA